MRLFSSCLAMFTAFVVLSPSARADLVGYWNFDENGGAQLNDSSGHGNHGTIVNSPGWVAGHTGAATDYSLNFDGTNYVDLSNPADLQITGDQTISMWLYPTNVAVSRQNPYAKAYGGEGTITQETSSYLNYYHGTSGANASPYQGFSGSSGLVQGQWNYVAVVRDLTNGELHWYVNGVANSTVANYSAAVAGTNNAYIATGYAGRYRGMIDDLAIWSQPLNGVEISTLRAGLSTPGNLVHPIEVVAYTYDATPNAHSDYYKDEGKDPNEDGVVDNPTGDLTDAILMGGAIQSGPDDTRIGWLRDTPVNLVFDFGRQAWVTDAMIGYHYNAGASNDAPDDVQISFSTDGVNFSTPITYTGFTGQGNHNDLFLDLPDTWASHVKLYFDGGTANGLGKYLLDEVAFFSIPEPSTFVLSAFGLLGLSFAGWRKRKRLA